MTPDDWRATFIAAHEELDRFTADGIRLGDYVTEREAQLLDQLDELESIAAANVRREFGKTMTSKPEKVVTGE